MTPATQQNGEKARTRNGAAAQTARAGRIALVAALVALAACTDADGTRARSASIAPGERPASVTPPGRATVVGGNSHGEGDGVAPSPAGERVGGHPGADLALTGLVIVVDPGHNGGNAQHPAEISRQVDAGGFSKACNTTGTSGDDGWSEAAFNWEMAQLLDRLLTADGAAVSLTRTDDAGWGPCIDDRGKRAAEVGAHLLISLHADGGPVDGSGFHVIHPGPLAGYTDTTAASSAAFARSARDHLVDAGLAPADYVAHDGLDERSDLGTLNRSPAPSVMVELANMRNPHDLASMRDEQWRSTLATALVAAITDHWEAQADQGRARNEGRPR